MIKLPADPVDVLDFQFKLQCRLKVFDNTQGNLPKVQSNLVAAASKFGLIFVGCNTPKLQVIRFTSIEDYSPSENVSNYVRREISLPSIPQFISVNFDHSKLSIVVEKNACPVAVIYDVKSFVQQNVIVLNEIILSTTPNVKVLEANWHPVTDIFTECKSDGTLGVYEIQGQSVNINKLPPEANVTCFCWSPKGKQIAVGSKDGTIIHYHPNLKAVKIVSAPRFENFHEMIALKWISSYQFIGTFKPVDNSDDQCSILLIDAPKTGGPGFTDFFDVCFSGGNYRDPQFYLIFEPTWNVVIVASANGMEVGVLASTGDSWVQWLLPDTARAELPLDEKKEETYPVGITIDTSSVKPVPWGESSLPPCPSLLLLSNQGILCSFKMINLKEGAANINHPPESLSDLSGIGAFTAGSSTPVIQQVPQITSTQAPPQQQAEAPKLTFGLQKPAEPAPPLSSPFSFQSQQITIQPVPQAATSNQPPQLPSNLFGGQLTITPVTGATSNNASSIGSMLFANANTKQSTPVVAPSLVPLGPQTTNTGQAQQFPVALEKPKIVAPQPEDVNQIQHTTPAVAENEPTNEEIEKLLNQSIQMECAAIEKQLQIVVMQGKQLEINLNPSDMDAIMNRTKDIEDFIKELVETSESQNSEVHVLKQNVVQSWAWYEEAKSRLKESKNEELRLLWKSKPLDSVSEKHLHTMKIMGFYLDSQLSQAHGSLDDQWDKFQEHCRKMVRSQLPTMEAIFQTLVKHNAILQKHTYLLRDIASQIKGRRRAAGHASLFSRSSIDASLEESFRNIKLEAEDISQIYRQKVMNRLKSISTEKVNELRKVLEKRKVTRVAVKSHLANSILQISPEKKDRSIFVHMTPTSKSDFVRKLNFHQSTPLNAPLSAFASINSAMLNEKLDQKNTGQPITTITFQPSVQKDTTASSPFVQSLKPKTVDQPTVVPPKTNSFFGFPTSSTFVKPLSAPSVTASLVTKTFDVSTNQPTSTAPTSFFTPIISKPSAFTALPTQTAKSESSNGAPKEAAPITSFFGLSTSTPKTSPATSLVVTTQSGIFKTTTPFTTDKTTVATEAKSQSIFSSMASSTANIFGAPASTLVTPVATAATPKVTQAPSIVNSSGSSTSTLTGFSFTAPKSIATSLPGSTTQPVSSSLFGNVATTTQSISMFGSSSATKSIFDNAKSSASTNSPFAVSSILSTTTQTSIFGSNTVSSTTTKTTTATVGNVTSTTIIGTSAGVVESTPSTTVAIFGTRATTAGTTSAQIGTSIFASPSTTATKSLFGTSSSNTSTVTTPIFGAATTATTSVFGTTSISATTTGTGSTPSFFSTPSTLSTFTFGPSTSTVTSGTPSIFGAATPTTTASLFGPSVATTTSAPSVFGATIPTTIKPSVFGATTSSAGSTVPSMFGVTSPATTSIFTQSSTGTPSIFGANTPATTTSLFGSTSTTTSASSSIFAATTTTSFTFGGAATSPFATSSASSPFKSSPFGTTTSSASPFGNTVTSSTSPFGAQTTSTASPFGAPASSSSVFGAVVTSASSPFGATSPFAATTSTTGSIFGTTSQFGSTGATPSVFGSPPAFGQSSTTFGNVFGPTSSTSAPVFGQTSSSSIFGSTASTNVFGGASTTTSSVFGSSSPFGVTSPAATTSSPFSQSSGGGIFGTQTGNTETASFGFGGLNVGEASQSPFAKTTETKSPFGAGTFNTTASSGSLFGSTNSFGSGSVFGQSAFKNTSTFGNTQPQQSAGPFSGGGGSVAESGFGAAAAFPKPAFGAQPAFGGAPAFGAAPTFGGSPTFGGGSVFGSPGKVFGSQTQSTTGVFGSNAQQGTGGFGNMANQNTIGFGNLAQQSTNTNQNSPFSGTSSFSSWR